MRGGRLPFPKQSRGERACANANVAWKTGRVAAAAAAATFVHDIVPVVSLGLDPRYLIAC